MIKTGHFRKFRKIDFIAILILAVFWAFVTFLVNMPDNQLSFMLSLFVTTSFVAVTALLVRKIGAVTLFYLFGAIISLPINNLGGLSGYKVPILLIAGLIFEVFFLLFKIRFKNIPLNMVLGTAFSNFSIPFAMLLFVGATKELMPYVWNLALMAFILGVMASVVIFLAWYNIKGLKPIIRFQYSA